MSSLSKETLELIADWAEILTVALALASAFCGVVLVIANKPLKKLEALESQHEQQKTALAQQQAAEATAKVAQLDRGVAEAKAEMAKQQTRAATAEKALLELQQRLAHRRISKPDHDKFVAALLPFRGSIIALNKLTTDSEAAQFSDDIIAVFTDAKWQIVLSTTGQVSPPRFNLFCSVDDSSKAGKALLAVLGMLPNAGIQRASRTDGTIAEIVVGLKPPA